MNVVKPIIFTYLIIALFACKSSRNVVMSAEEFEEALLDTLVITDEAGEVDTVPTVFRPSATLPYDIQHTKLMLSFDWSKQHVLGRAELTIAPYFHPVEAIVLDAVGFVIHGVSVGPVTAAHTYDGQKLEINLGRNYTRGESFVVRIDYTARPEETPAGGSDAITSEKGLFFIDPLDEDPDLPSQIWTQGETENNRRWFPTFDKPNERFTQEILLTVDTLYETLSNGKLLSSVLNGDGTRTDHWKQDRPHAPYLAMIAVGDFHTEPGEWKNIPLHYLVEKKYARHASRIFNHTPEMLSFFSETLNFPYPWDKYSQVVVRNFVSGAMENTGAVVFGDFVQKTDKELIDNGNDEIVAHEMMHHWFGNLVTCEDWSQLTLNEGFANYAEYLWLEHKYGKDRAEEHRLNEMGGYFNQTYTEKPHPLVDYFYPDKEKMFDAHSYNKGGLVLHMLRRYVGDDAFFTALNRYLTLHQNSAVEVDELRLAFEDVTGEDLNWFFNQWYLQPGHPLLSVQYRYDSLASTLRLQVQQTQDVADNASVFRLPLRVATYDRVGKVTFHSVTLDSRDQEFVLEGITERPAVTVLDGDASALALVSEEKSREEYEAQFLFSPHFMDKYEAMYQLQPLTEKVIERALEDSYTYFRAEAVRSISDSLAAGYAGRLQAMALSDPHSQVRREALIKLSMAEDVDVLPICQTVMLTESAYPVIDVALQIIAIGDPEKAAKYVERFRNEDSDYLSATLVGVLPELPTDADIEFMEKKARTVGVNHMIDYFGACQTYLQGKPVSVLEKVKTFMSALASDPGGNVYRKYLAFVTLLQMGYDLSERSDAAPDIQTDFLLESLAETIRFIVENEQNPVLKEKYSELR